MDLRDLLLRAVATPDRAWLTLLAGLLLIARECAAPGRIVPGLIGAVLLLTAAWHVPAAVPCLLAGGVLLILQARHRAWFAPGVAAAGLVTFAARQAGTGWPIAIASIAVVSILTVLIRIGVIARQNKIRLSA